MKHWLIYLAALAGTVSGAMEKSLVFRMDFDSPVKLGTETLKIDIPSCGIVPGKFGNGFYFQRKSFNFLPAGAADPADKGYFIAEKGCVLSFEKDKNDPVLAATKGSFRMKETAVRLVNEKNFFVKPMTALTYSCQVKGPKGAKIVLNLAFVPETVAPVNAKKMLDRFAKNKSIVPDPAFAAKFRPDIPGKKEIVLTGDWQNVSVYAQTDVRSVTVRSIRAVGGADIQSEGKVFFKKMQMEATMSFPFHTYLPTAFLRGGTGRPENGAGIKIVSDSVRKLFPVKEGTIVFFTKTPGDVKEFGSAGGFFCYGSDWHAPLWCVDTGRNVAGTIDAKGGVYLKQPSLTRKEWTHYAMTWTEKETVVYLNGKKMGSQPRSFKEFSPAKHIFCVGANIWPQTSANSVMDEFMIFSKALSPEEVAKLSSSSQPFASAQKK